MTEYAALQPLVLDAAEAAEYLRLTSERSLEPLVQSKRLIPLKLGKANVFLLSELRRFIAAEYAKQCRERGVSVSRTEGIDHAHS